MLVNKSFTALAVIIVSFAGLILLNTSSGGLFTGATTDLAVTDIQVPDRIPAGDNADVTVTVKNKGSTPVTTTEPVEVLLKDGASFKTEETFTDLGAGETREFVFTYTRTSPVGGRRLTGVVDPDNQIAELSQNRENNREQESTRVYSNPPSVTANHSPQQPDTGDDIEIEASIQDEDGVDTATVYHDEETVETCHYNNTPYNVTYVSTSCSATIPSEDVEAGTHSYHATATDVHGAEGESDTHFFTVSEEENESLTVETTYTPTNPTPQDELTVSVSADTRDSLEEIRVHQPRESSFTLNTGENHTFTDNSGEEHRVTLLNVSNQSNATYQVDGNKTYTRREGEHHLFHANTEEETPLLLEEVLYRFNDSGQVTFTRGTYTICEYIDGETSSDTCSFVGGPYESGVYNFTGSATDYAGNQDSHAISVSVNSS